MRGWGPEDPPLVPRVIQAKAGRVCNRRLLLRASESGVGHAFTTNSNWRFRQICVMHAAVRIWGRGLHESQVLAGFARRTFLVVIHVATRWLQWNESVTIVAIRLMQARVVRFWFVKKLAGFHTDRAVWTLNVLNESTFSSQENSAMQLIQNPNLSLTLNPNLRLSWQKTQNGEFANKSCSSQNTFVKENVTSPWVHHIEIYPTFCICIVMTVRKHAADSNNLFKLMIQWVTDAAVYEINNYPSHIHSNR